MYASANIDNAMEAIAAAVAQFNTLVDSGTELTKEDIDAIVELDTASRDLRNMSIRHYSLTFSHAEVAKAFNLSVEYIGDVVNGISKLSLETAEDGALVLTTK